MKSGVVMRCARSGSCSSATVFNVGRAGARDVDATNVGGCRRLEIAQAIDIGHAKIQPAHGVAPYHVVREQ